MLRYTTLVPSLGLRIGPTCEAGLITGVRMEHVPPQKRKKKSQFFACLSGGSVAVPRCLAIVIDESRFEARAGQIIVSGYSGICFEINFSGRHRGFDVSSLICDHWLILGLEMLSMLVVIE